ncbi:hypothetical protein D3C79_907040 [compost metagenome]
MVRSLLLAGECQHARRQIERGDLFPPFTPTAAEVPGTAACVEQLFAPMLRPHPQQALTDVTLQHRRRIIAARRTAEGRGYRLLVDRLKG